MNIDNGTSGCTEWQADDLALIDGVCKTLADMECRVRLGDDVHGTCISFSAGTFANPSKPLVSNCRSRFSVERELCDLCAFAIIRQHEVAQCPKCPSELMMIEMWSSEAIHMEPTELIVVPIA